MNGVMKKTFCLFVAGMLLLGGCAAGDKVAEIRSGSGSTTGGEEGASDMKESGSAVTDTEGSAGAAADDSGAIASSIEELGLDVPVRPEPAVIAEIDSVRLHAHEPEPEDGSLPRIDIELPEDYELSNSEYTRGTVEISNAGEYDLSAKKAKVRIRGNSTAEVAKRPLKVRFEEKQSLFGKNKEKTWTLIANIYDKTSLHNYISYDLYDYLSPEGSFTPLCLFVDVYVNGDYQGVYNLCDQVETGKDRVPIKGKPGNTPEQTDYLIVQDFRVPAEKPDDEDLKWFWLSWANYAFAVKSPEADDGLTSDHTAYIKGYMDDVYEAMRIRNWNSVQELIDVDSFIAGQATAEVSKNMDITQASLYMYKPADGKLTFGPAWDFDMTFGSGTVPEAEPEGFATENSVIFGCLMSLPQYREKYLDFFNAHYDDIISHVNAKIDEAEELYGDDLEREYEIWTSRYDLCRDELKGLETHAEQVEAMKQWFATRMEWLAEAYF